MKIIFKKYISKLSEIFVLFFALINIQSNQLRAEESYSKEIEIDNSTKFDENNSKLPTNPFEIVDMIRRANSMNNATKPSDAIDDALNLFNNIEDQENL